MKVHTLFRDGNHRWLTFGRDPAKPDNIIDTNQLVVCAGDQALLIDPGGTEVFPAMLSALTEQVPIDQVRGLFISHQDPDVSSSIPLWRRICGHDLDVYAPWMWSGFISHFDRDAKLTKIPDEGMQIRLDTVTLEVLPAHYLHSPGNYSVYDPKARLLFSGDIGAALVPPDKADEVFVSDFREHIAYMEGFHRRWMGSPAARDAWVAMVAKLDVQVMAPQHGKMLRGDDVGRFLDWLSTLDIGTGVAAMKR